MIGSCLQWRHLLWILVVLSVGSLTSMFLFNMCSVIVCPNSPKLAANTSAVRTWDYRLGRNHTRRYHFDINSDDVMVYLHIQKTGGTSFGRHLVKNLDIERPCSCRKGRKQCPCYRPKTNRIWQFSRYSTGWKCGVHADWTELRACVPKYLENMEGKRARRRIFLVTLLREPVRRFLSEYYHVRRGATWKGSLHMCDGRKASEKELPRCYKGEDWRNVTLDEFISCPWNLAINRQTRMLADLTLVNCYNTKTMTQATRDRLLLTSAKKNLRRMTFFGLLEEFKDAQFVFEQTFGLRFLRPFEEYIEDMTHASDYLFDPVENSTLSKIRELNHLDIQLYDYAKTLFHERVLVYRGKVKGYR